MHCEWTWVIDAVISVFAYFRCAILKMLQRKVKTLIFCNNFCVARHRCGQCRGHDTRCNFASRWQRNKKTKIALRAREKIAACTHSFAHETTLLNTKFPKLEVFKWEAAGHIKTSYKICTKEFTELTICLKRRFH